MPKKQTSLTDFLGRGAQSLGLGFRSEDLARETGKLGRGLLDSMFGVPQPPPQNATMLDKAVHALSYPGVMPIGATVYHGTPHRFPPTPKNPLGEFDLSKIGTGEGAQAYGHGLYFAEAPQTAKYYQKELIGELGDTAKEWVGKHGGQAKALRAASREMKQALASAKDPGERLDLTAYYKPLVYELSTYRPGKLFKADLPDEAIPKMLDWDAPLSQQAPGVAAKALAALPKHLQATMREIDAKGSDVYRELQRVLGGVRPGAGGAEQAGAQLGRFGIPGIKYLDQGSRVGGKGTRNFVVWEKQALPTIQGVE